jgi:hypothetical protein
MIRTLAIFTSIYLAATFAPAVTAEDVTAESIVKAHVEAVGGVQNIKKVTTMKRSGIASMEGAFGQMEGTFEEISVIDKKAYSNVEFSAFTQSSGWDGTIGWSQDDMQGLRDIEGDELEILKSQAQVDALAAAWIKSGAGAFTLVSTASGEGADSVHKVTIAAEEDIVYDIDPATHHVKRISLPFNDPNLGESTIVLTCDEYTEHNGVKLPGKLTVDIGQGTIIVVYDYNETEINGTIDEATFAKP